MARQKLIIALALVLAIVAIAEAQTVITGARSMLSGNITFSWTLDENTETIEHTLTVKSVRTWIGFGWTHNRTAIMAFAPMIVVTFNNQTGEPILDCYIGAHRNTWPIKTPTCWATLTKTIVDEEAGETTIVFKRNLAVDKGTEAFNYPIADGPMCVIVAYGYPGRFFYHFDRRESVTLNYWDPTVMLPRFANHDVVIGKSVMNDDYSLYWFIDAHSNMITFQMIASTTGWFAMALSPRETLADGAITVCSLNNNKNNSLSLSNWYAIKDNAKPAYGPFNFATPVASHYNSVEKKSSCTFTRSLQAQHPYYDRSIINDTVHVLWAFGQKKELSDHGKNRGSVRLNLMGGPIEPPKSNVMKAVLLWVHGGLMLFAWGLCSTVGIYFSRFGRRKFPLWWLKGHIISFALCMVCTAIGFVVILWREKWKLKLYKPHALIGFVSIIAAVLQSILGVVTYYSPITSRGEAPLFPNRIHWYFGRMLWLVGLVNNYIGLELASAHYLLTVSYFFYVSFVIAIFAFSTGSTEAKLPPIPDSIDPTFTNIEPNERNPLIQK